KKVDNNTENQKLLILKGDIYFELENYEEAKKAYEKAFDLDDNEIATSKYGKVLSVTKDFIKSEKLLKNGIDDFEKSIPIRLELASNYIRAGKLTDAEVQIKRARDINENDPRIYITEGDMYFDQRVYELSKKSYEKALALDENQKEARSKLATSYYWLANREADQDLSNELFTMSLKEWDRVTKQDTMDASAFFNKGKILFFAKQYKDAVPALFRYYELRPDGNLGRWYLGQSLYELGLCDSAAPQLKYVSENIDSVKFK
ncbi:MAG: tetratricopeptide repeat protein, partial [Candidatus Kapaibacterium sp.]